MKNKIFRICLFLFLAIPGALLFGFSSIFLIIQFFEPKQELVFFYPTILSLVGAIATLAGIEKIKQWKYIFVFASITFSFFISLIVTVIVTPIRHLYF
jgi:hypothetical protein